MQKLIYIFCFISLLFLSSCSLSKQIDKVAKKDIINKTSLTSAHVGISIYNASENKYLYNYQGDKYFIPASNTKIITCYAGMKYLGDSLVGLKVWDCQNTLLLFPTGDPTLLHPDFITQPVIDFLKQQKKLLIYIGGNWNENAYGNGWSWDDYNDDYMAERSALPVFGNVVSIFGNALNKNVQPPVFSDSVNIKDSGNYINGIKRSFFKNYFEETKTSIKHSVINTPFITSDALSLKVLNDTTHKEIKIINGWSAFPPVINKFTIHSQPADSLLKIMMHRSDNFFAEQSLLMVSNEMLGVMNDEKIIDTLLKTDFKEMPQRPQWVDGSGLSRYNLFTPQDFVFALNKMRNEFSWNRITTIFPTGGSGTLGDRFKNLAGKIFAKTGSLSNNIALSGYIITKKNRTLIFSVLVGNHMSATTELRDDVAKFLTSIAGKY